MEFISRPGLYWQPRMDESQISEVGGSRRSLNTDIRTHTRSISEGRLRWSFWNSFIANGNFSLHSQLYFGIRTCLISLELPCLVPGDADNTTYHLALTQILLKNNLGSYINLQPSYREGHGKYRVVVKSAGSGVDKIWS